VSAVKHGLAMDRLMVILSNSSVRHHGCSMVADAGGVGGEAWTCDGQTNGNFIQFVCLSPLLLDVRILSRSTPFGFGFWISTINLLPPAVVARPLPAIPVRNR
jgi:hypothetical protein